MKTTLTILATLFGVTSLAACGDEATGPGGETVEDVSQADAESDSGRPVPDTGSDDTAEPDATDDDVDVVEDAAVDTSEMTDTAADVTVDAADGSGDTTEDVVEDIGPPPDAGTDCVEDPSICELPYTCMTGVCRLSLSGRSFAERDFRIEEPEELTRLFTVLKGLAADVRFIALDMEVDPGSSEIFTEAGSADLVDGTTAPVQIRWQLTPHNFVTFRPINDPAAPLDGDRWVSDVAPFAIDAILTIDFGTPQVVRAGFDIEELAIELALNSASEEATGVLTGYVTRAETESREMIEAAAFPTFSTLFCSDRSYEPDDGLWNMSDVLDCNGAPLDADLDGDDVNDAYYMRIEASFNAATFVP